ncbi:hypothetical protein [Clostridium senegalense]
MSEISCIYETTLINENEKEDLLEGKNLEILIALLSSTKTATEISKELNIPIFSTQLYLNRLLKCNLIEICSVKVLDGKIEKKYQLRNTDIEFLKNIKIKGQNKNKLQIKLAANKFSNLTKDVIEKLSENKDHPYKIKAHFIKADKEKMEEFRIELEKLFEKFENSENKNAKDTYTFISTFALYRNLKESE